MDNQPRTDHIEAPEQSGDGPIAFQEHEIPTDISALFAIADPDYTDLFILPTDATSAGTPHQWARAALDDVAGRAGQFIWRVLLGLRLSSRRSPTHIAGWPIVGSGENWLVLQARSWMLTGNLVIYVDATQCALATVIRYDRRIAEPIWNTLSAKHRSLAPALLRDAWAVVHH
ncbi:hypothetical protein [Nocardia cyriacigeorgica]|uniref:hypothetical protein n=1 Tax=Nocardia cyriacigeorgica TaxID=135487 RepID=UPI001C498964|nr:hypothetical protein [Nocardia cyriacigeorgica]